MDQKSCWLVFLDEYGLGAKLARELQQAGQKVTLVKVGTQFNQVSEETYTINPQAREDYHALLKALCAAARIPDTILHLWCLTEAEMTSWGSELSIDPQSLSFYGLIFLAQAIGDQLSGEAIQIKVFSNHLQDVTGNEFLSPEKATLLGPCRVVSQEYPNIQCTSVDVVLPKMDMKQEDELQELLLGELATKTSDPVVAYRGKHRWVQIFEPVRLEKVANLKPMLREKGVYLITGGLGGIGFALAEYLAQTVHPRLVLIARRALPPRNEWEQWLKAHGEADTVSQRIRKVESIETLGAEVLSLSADVADMNQMKGAIGRAYDQFGEIHGVIHAAGVGGGGLIQLKTPEAADAVLAPKVKGTLVLDRLLSGTKLDFFVLCSSTRSILGGVGQVDYSAGNAFLDMYAHQNHSTKGAISINWCAWREVGLTVDTIVPDDLKEEREQDLKVGIMPGEGKEVFGRILSSSFPQVIVSTQDFLSLVKSFKKVPASVSAVRTEKISLAKPAHARPDLLSAYVAPGNPTEEAIANIWQDLLCIDKVGIYDNFFELGGNSLLAVKVIARLRNEFHKQIPMASLFERPTVHLLGEMILGEKGVSSFEESSSRGQKRKEKRLLRMAQQQGDE